MTDWINDGTVDLDLLLAPSGKTSRHIGVSTGDLFYIGRDSSVRDLTISTTGNAVLTGSLTTGAPTSGTAAAWKLGTVVTGVTSTFVTTNYIQLDVGGTLYKLATVTSVP